MAATFVSESTSLLPPVDLSIFRTLENAQQYFEPWMVDEPYTAFDAVGHRLIMRPASDRYEVRFQIVQNEDPQPSILEGLIKGHLKLLTNPKVRKPLDLNSKQIDTMTLNELLETIGKYDLYDT